MPSEATAQFIEGLIPRPRQEFEDLVRRAHQTPLPEYVFAESVYRASLRGDTLHSGTATLQPFPRTVDERTRTRRVLSFDSNLSIKRPAWRTQDETRLALVGSDSQSQLVFLDGVGEQLEFAWTRRGRQVGDVTMFQLRLPPALIYRLELQIPPDTWISSSHGLVTPRPSSNPNAQSVLLEWSDQAEIELAVHPNRGREDFRGKAKLVTSTSYVMSPSGVKINSDLRLTAGLEPVRSLRFRFHGDLQVTQVVADDAPLAWTTSGNNLHIEMPATTRKEWQLQVTAFSPIALERSRELPRLETEDVDWTAGTALVRVLSPLEVTDLQLSACRCVDMTSTVDRSETLQLVLDEQAASIGLELARRSASADIQALASLLVEPNSISAEVEVRVAPQHRELFETQLAIRSTQGWILEANSVEVVRDDGMGASVDRLRATKDQIAISLSQPINADRPLRLRLQLVNDTLRDPLLLSQLMPITIPGHDAWVHLRGTNGLQLNSEHVERSSWPTEDTIASAPAWIQSKLSTSDTDVLLDDGDLFFRFEERRTTVQLLRRSTVTPTLVNSMTTVVVDEKDWKQVVRIQIDPAGKEIQELKARFSRPVPMNVVWKLDGGSQRTIETVVQRAEEGGSEQHHLVFTESQSEPFSVSLEFESSHGFGEFEVPLVTLDGAANETSQVAVYGAYGTTVELSPGELTAMPYGLVAHAEHEARHLHGVYSYHATANLYTGLSRASAFGKTNGRTSGMAM